jgi:hypothetical protein
LTIEGGGASVIAQELLISLGAVTVCDGGSVATTANAGLTNVGSLTLGPGSTDVYGDVTNEVGGRITGTATFYDNVINSGEISPGSSAGTMLFRGDVVNEGSFNIELGGLDAGTEHDVLDVQGLLTLGGTLDISLIDGFAPAAGNRFDVLNWGSLNGEFDTVSLPTLGDPALYWDTTSLYTDGSLLVGSGADPSDEWSDIPPINGEYSRIYFDYNGTTFFCINDWVVNRLDGGVQGGLHPDEYNEFRFSILGNRYTLRLYPDDTAELYVNGVLTDLSELPNFQSATGWGPSPNLDIPHTIWEFQFDVTPQLLGRFKEADPRGGGVPIWGFPGFPDARSWERSVFPHITDGAFSDFELPSVAPIPTRPYQWPVFDPRFEPGWFEITLLEGGGIEFEYVYPEPRILTLLAAGLLGLRSRRRRA